MVLGDTFALYLHDVTGKKEKLQEKLQENELFILYDQSKKNWLIRGCRKRKYYSHNTKSKNALMSLLRTIFDDFVSMDVDLINYKNLSKNADNIKFSQLKNNVKYKNYNACVIVSYTMYECIDSEFDDFFDTLKNFYNNWDTEDDEVLPHPEQLND